MSTVKVKISYEYTDYLNIDMPIEFKKTADGSVGFSISSVDPEKLGGFVEGSINVAVTVPDSTGAPISFANLVFNVIYTYYNLQNDVAYTTYPFATVARPNSQRLLAYRFRAYDSVLKFGFLKKKGGK